MLDHACYWAQNMSQAILTATRRTRPEMIDLLTLLRRAGITIRGVVITPDGTIRIGVHIPEIEL